MAPPLPSSCHLTAECPLGWHGPGCQRPCECEHQCPCDPQTGNCNLTQAPNLSSILSQGTVPPDPSSLPPHPTPRGWALSLTLVSYSEAVSPAIPGQPADERILPPHWVGALLGSGAGVGDPSLYLRGTGQGQQVAAGTQMIVFQREDRESHSGCSKGPREREPGQHPNGNGGGQAWAYCPWSRHGLFSAPGPEAPGPTELELFFRHLCVPRPVWRLCFQA